MYPILFYILQLLEQCKLFSSCFKIQYTKTTVPLTFFVVVDTVQTAVTKGVPWSTFFQNEKENPRVVQACGMKATKHLAQKIFWYE